jgi:hypothetical protein
MPLNQNDNIVGGSFAGRDLSITNIHPQSTQIKLLCERLMGETDGSSAAPLEFIEELQHYLDKPASDFGRTLAEKLTDSERAELIAFAQEAKERAMKKIMRFQSSRTAQEILAYVLSELHTRFVLHVGPLVASKASRADIDAVTQEKVIAPVVDALGPSPLVLNQSTVFALLFYLAGNCHIKWD